jgi:moderate conductance mechanosensitive channel
MREFQRRIRLALEQNHLLPGDPLRVFNSFDGTRQAATASPGAHEAAPPKPKDPTTLKPQETNPFTGEG